MSLEEVKEKISSLYDDELNASDCDRIIDRLKVDSDTQDTWQRYGLIGDALKKNLPDNVEHNLFSRVQAAMESESAHVPSTSEVENTPKADVIEIKKKPANSKVFNHPAMGFGIAASVALVSVLGFQMLSSPTDVPLQQGIVASTQESMATQEINITPVVTVTEEAMASTPTFTEQSVADEEQWTRITLIDNTAPDKVELGGEPDFQSGSQPVVRSVNMEESLKQ